MKTSKGNIIEAQILVRKILKGHTLMPSETSFFNLAFHCGQGGEEYFKKVSN